MHNDLREIYHWTLSKYRKYNTRLKKNIQSGRFYELSERKQFQILSRIKRLKSRLEQLRLQLKIGLAAGAISLALSTAPVHAQQLGPFVENEEANPFRINEINGQNKKLTFADIDNDGDLDLAVGIISGQIDYYENIGNVNHPNYAQRFKEDNPFETVNVPNSAAPEFVDFDGDGDTDLVLGEQLGAGGPGVHYFRNEDFEDDGLIGNNPSFTEVISPGSPIDNVSISGYDLKPTIIDIDNDGDLDIFVGRNGGSADYQSLIFYENNAGVFGSKPLPSGLDPFNFDTSNSSLTPTFVDIDGDGDFDLFTGNFNGTIRFFENSDADDGIVGDNPTFTEVTGINNPLDLANVFSFSTITFADLDGDGDKDAVIGQGLTGAPPAYFENTSSGFVQLFDQNNPFDDFDTGFDASPTFVDIDNDGDMDAIVGAKYGGMFFLENNNRIFTALNGSDSPVDGLNSDARSSSPSFVQIDADGDYDLVVGLDSDPLTVFYRNNGDATSPTFASEGNLFTSLPISNGSDSSPTFGDITGDGIIDAVVGFEGQGTMRFFEGTSNAPAFIERTGIDNPFDGESVGASTNSRFAKPDLVDLDHDGDLDLAVGIHEYGNLSNPFEDGQVAYFENDGTNNFSKLIGTQNPFDGIIAASSGQGEYGDSEPTFVDIDLDGDLDMFVGNANGQVQFFENTNQPPLINSNNPSTNFIEGSGEIQIDPTLSLSDDGNDDILSAQVAIVSGLARSEDILEFTPEGNVTGTYDSNTGILSLTGYDNMTVYQNVLRSVTYDNNSQRPDPATRSIQITAVDFDATNANPGNAITFEIGVDPVNDPPFISSDNNQSIEYIRGSGPVIVDMDLSVSDNDDENIESLMISVNRFELGDIIDAIVPSGLSKKFDSTEGTMEITGPADLATYRDILRSVSFETDNSEGSRTIELVANDGEDDSNVRTVNIFINNPEEITVYNAVSPNGDDKNEFFELSGITSPNTVQIYNRWGDIVYETSDYDNRTNRFEGLSDNNKELPSGTYFYKIKTEEKELTGYLVLKR